MWLEECICYLKLIVKQRQFLWKDLFSNTKGQMKGLFNSNLIKIKNYDRKCTGPGFKGKSVG
jgi:hypothetical protein